MDDSQRDALQEVPSRILEAVSRVVVGKEEVKLLLLSALLSGGHVLIEGMAGTAKTLLAKAFALAIGGEFKRIQLTSDLLPTDVTGFYLYRPDGSSKFVPGPIFANIVLADELNRTTPRTQAAFLEAMQERQVTIEGSAHPLPEPFMVIASQLPTGGAGTYPLADVQADRFMFRAWSAYPAPEEEAEVLSKIDVLEEPRVEPVTTPETVLALRERVRDVFVSEAVRGYVVELVNRVRGDPDVLVGPSPRASVALYKGSRALAYVEGRDYVLPDDVKRLVLPAMVHRIHVRSEAEMDGVTPETVLQRALESVEVPKAGP
jgi:MoxR-like ATPase